MDLMNLEEELRKANFALQNNKEELEDGAFDLPYKYSSTPDYKVLTLCAAQCVKGVHMDKRIEQEFFLVYETLLSILEECLEECKDSPVLDKFSIDAEKQIKEFKEKYPEVVSEYYLKHRP